MKIQDVIITPFNEATFLNKMWNYDNPIAEKTINGKVYRIADGFIIDKKKSYILYKGGKLVGTYTSVEEAKEFVPQ